MKKFLVISVYSFLILSTLLVFWQVRNFDFVNYDDNVYVYENLHVLNGLTPDGIISGFYNPQHRKLAAADVAFFYARLPVVRYKPRLDASYKSPSAPCKYLAAFCGSQENDRRTMAERICCSRLCPASDACRIGRVDYGTQGCAEHIVSAAYIGCLCQLCQTPQPGSLSADSVAVRIRPSCKTNARYFAVPAPAVRLLAAESILFPACKDLWPPAPQARPHSRRTRDSV